MLLHDEIKPIGSFDSLLFAIACRQVNFASGNTASPGPVMVLLADSDIKTNTSGLEFLTFILDEDFKVENTSVQIVSALSILKMPFCELLAPESKPLWMYVEHQIHNTDGFLGTFQFTLIDQRKRSPALCSLIRLGKSGRTVVNTVVSVTNTSYNSDVPDQQIVNQETIRLEKLYHYIIEHLDKPLPSAFELAKRLGTNDHALKEGFRRTFGTSIYQFYMTEKLKRAHLYIEQSTLPLHQIATDLGFGTYGNFSKAFRKKYRYAPSDVKRPD